MPPHPRGKSSSFLPKRSYEERGKKNCPKEMGKKGLFPLILEEREEFIP